AGGTTERALVLKDGILAPARLVDITRLPLKGITVSDTGIQVGAITTMEELAADPTVTARLPFVREALLAGASVQLRTIATIGGEPRAGTRPPLFWHPPGGGGHKRPGAPRRRAGACHPRTPRGPCSS